MRPSLLLLLSSILCVSACWELEAKEPTAPPVFKWYTEKYNDGWVITRLIDTEAQVICYRTSDGLSCLSCSVAPNGFCE